MKLAIFAVAILALGTASASAQDLARGEQSFKKCMVCHAVGEGAQNRVGPVLNGVFGRTAGTAPDYKYSKAMTEAGAAGLVWNHFTIGHFLHKPREFVNGTKMTFPGFKNDQEIEDVLAYLQTFSPDYVPAEGEDVPHEQDAAH
jgi:cytochrome c